MDALFELIFDWSLSHFSQNTNIRIKNGVSCNNVRQVPQEMLKPEVDRSGGYRGKLDQSVIHG